jgi:site-specific DNA recombinase
MVERRCRIRGSQALLTGRLFDEQGRRMTPTHTNKKGVRYSYYVSQPMLHNHSSGPIGRVPAPELEAVVADAIHRHLQGSRTNPIPETDRELIERHLLRVTLGTKELMLRLRQDAPGNDPAGGDDDPILADAATTPVPIAIPWTAPTAPSTKGISYLPAHNTPMKPGSRQLLLIAIAKARNWMKDVERGHSFADIARQEGKAERHIRHLAPLAFVSPPIITAIIDGTAPTWSAALRYQLTAAA